MTGLATLAGAVAALVCRALFLRMLLARLRRDVRRLNAGDLRPLLAAYADDAVLTFDDGPHRWSGRHDGKVAIEQFLHEFTAAGLTGEIRSVWMAGPVWRLTLVARFDDRAIAPDGTELYTNRAVLVVRTRWGRITQQDDFYADTRRIDVLEGRLTELGIRPVGSCGP